MRKKWKGLIAISDVLDDRYKKLSDKYHDLELSYNRKKKALLRIEMAIDAIRRDNPRVTPIYDVSVDVLEAIESLCQWALFCDGREKYRVKGGKNEARKDET